MLVRDQLQSFPSILQYIATAPWGTPRLLCLRIGNVRLHTWMEVLPTGGNAYDTTNIRQCHQSWLLVLQAKKDYSCSSPFGQKKQKQGKTYPKGAFLGAEAFIDNTALELLRKAFEKCAKETPFSWRMPFDSLLQLLRWMFDCCGGSPAVAHDPVVAA